MRSERRRLTAIALVVLALHGFVAMRLCRWGLGVPQVAVPYRMPLHVHIVTEPDIAAALAIVTAAAHGDNEQAARRREASARRVLNRVANRSNAGVASAPAPTPGSPRKSPAEPSAPAWSSRAAETQPAADTPSALSANQAHQQESRTPEQPAQEPETAPSFDAAYLHNPAPEYPEVALRRRWEGTVLLNVHVLANGSAREVTVAASSGHDALDAAAMQAVADWHFVPAHRAGQAIDAWVHVPVIFKAA